VFCGDWDAGTCREPAGLNKVQYRKVVGLDVVCETTKQTGRVISRLYRWLGANVIHMQCQHKPEIHNFNLHQAARALRARESCTAVIAEGRREELQRTNSTVYGNRARARGGRRLATLVAPAKSVFVDV